VDSVLLTPVPVSAYVFVYDQQNQPINGADVYVNSTVEGTTNSYGRALLQSLVSGTYTIVVKKSGYSPVSQQIAITNDSSEFDVVLSLATVSQTIFVQDTDQKNIADATVILNGAVAGITDSHGELDAQLTYATPYNITVTHDGYNTKTVQKEIPLGNTTTALTITLEKSLDWGFITLVGIGILVILFLFVIIRRAAGHRSARSSTRRGEI